MVRTLWRRLRRPPKWMMVVAALAIILALGLWVASIIFRPHLPTPAERTAEVRKELIMSDIAQAYFARCSYCHDTGIAPSLKGRGLSAEEMTSFVRNGVNGMPAFPPVAVSDKDIAGIALYMRSYSRNEAAK